MKGLSFDLSKTNTGVVLWEGHDPLRCISMSYKDYPDLGEMLMIWRGNLRAITSKQKPAWCAFEAVRPISLNHMEIHFGMLGQLALECHQRGTVLVPIYTPTAKKRLTGNGRASKADMLAAAKKLFPQTANHDEADALAVGLAALDKMEFRR